ncbi:MAG: hypothetical protein IKV17_05600 [Bacteroidaceae bacterium]|nr:hypothetical protein [Bacteroidaceae bacterium]
MKSEKYFFNSWFTTLNNNNVKYAVLRNYESLPENSGGSDIDIWVKKEDYNKFIYITNNCAEKNKIELTSYTPDKNCPKICYLGVNYGVQIDVFCGDITYKRATIFPENVIELNIILYRKIPVIKKSLSALIAFIKEILNNGKCDAKYIKGIIEEKKNLDEQFLESSLKIFNKDFIISIYDSIQSNNIDNNIKELTKIGRESIKKNTIGRYYGFLCKLRRLFKQPGYTIAFLGTDGSGKSTIINAVTPILNKGFHNGIRYEHMRPNYIPSLAEFIGKKNPDTIMEICSNPHASKPSGFVGSLLRISYYMSDYTFGYFRKVFLDKAFKTHIWVFDRYYYDYFIDPRRGRISLPKWILKFFGLFVPTPDIILCLGGDPTKIYERKPETSLQEVTRQTKALKAFCDNNKNAVWIDTTTTPQESIERVMTSIVEIMKKRFSNTKL